MPALTLIDEAGARWAITVGIGDARIRWLAAVDEALAGARPPRVPPESLTFGHGSMPRSQ